MRAYAPGPAVSPTGVEVAPVQPAGPFLAVDAMGDLPWNSWYQWEFFFMDLIEVINSGAGSFDEIWCRHLPPATDSLSSTTKLGPHAQENQTTLLHLLPTAVDIRSALDLLLVRSFPSHADDVVPPLSPRHSLKNGSKTFVRSATHTEACDVCTAAGKTSWHTPQQFKAHMEAHGPRQPCILCGKSLRNRYDAGTTHRHNGSCDVYNQLTARGDGLAALWAVIWGLREHKQWGRRDDIRDDEIDHIFGKP